MGCGNPDITRETIKSEPRGVDASDLHRGLMAGRPTQDERKELARLPLGADTRVDSTHRDYGMKGVSRYKGEDLDGTTHAYFGGLRKPDGPGHGHAIVDPRGNVKIVRDPYDPRIFGSRNRAKR